MLSAARKKLLKALINKLGLKSIDSNLLDEALTHPSFSFEVNKENAPDYERLEFLGDSVLRLVISNYLYDKYEEYDEGKLTKIRSYLVSDDFISKLALTIELNKYINIGEHEEKDGGRLKESILACSIEALFGAIYKSLGYNFAKEFIYKMYNKIDINGEEILFSYNSKEILQQYTQGKNKDLPVYKLLEEKGLAHNKTYVVSVEYEHNELGKGEGKTKKDAEKAAAYKALMLLKEKKEI